MTFTIIKCLNEVVAECRGRSTSEKSEVTRTKGDVVPARNAGEMCAWDFAHGEEDCCKT